MQCNAALSKADLQWCPAVNAMVWYDSSHCALALVPFLRRTVNLLRKEVKDVDISPSLDRELPLSLCVISLSPLVGADEEYL